MSLDAQTKRYMDALITLAPRINLKAEDIAAIATLTPLPEQRVDVAEYVKKALTEETLSKEGLWKAVMETVKKHVEPTKTE